MLDWWIRRGGMISLPCREKDILCPQFSDWSIFLGWIFLLVGNPWSALVDILDLYKRVACMYP